MFYYMDANKSNLTYILFYNVFIITVIVSKINGFRCIKSYLLD